MYADDAIATAPSAAFVTVGAPIIPAVAIQGKQLVLVIEMDLLQTGVAIATTAVSLFSDSTRWTDGSAFVE